MRTYTIYTQCDHCGVYDRDPKWCSLCQRTKDGRAKHKVSRDRCQSNEGQDARNGKSGAPKHLGVQIPGALV